MNDSDGAGNPYHSNPKSMPEQTTASFSRPNALVAIGCISLSIVLAASHWLFLENPHHRIGGVAWNSLFQLFGNFLAGLGAFGIFTASLAGKFSKSIGIPMAIVLALTAAYCLFQSFGMMLSI